MFREGFGCLSAVEGVEVKIRVTSGDVKRRVSARDYSFRLKLIIIFII